MYRDEAYYSYVNFKFLIDKKTVYAFTGFGILDSKYSIKYKLMKRIFFFIFVNLIKNKSFKIIVQNKENRNYLINSGISKKKISLIPGTGLDFIQKIKPRSYKRKIILLVEDFYGQRELKNLLNALNQVLNSYKIKFLLIGDPDLGSTDAVPSDYLNQILIEILFG